MWYYDAPVLPYYATVTQRNSYGEQQASAAPSFPQFLQQVTASVGPSSELFACLQRGGSRRGNHASVGRGQTVPISPA